MSNLTIGLSRITAAACATAITVISAWAFMDSTASAERDPFQIASTMAANSRLQVAQLQSHAATACRKKSETTDCPAS